MATEREVQVACLWGLKDYGVRELREEIIAQSPGAQVTYLLDKDIVVVKGCFDDATEAAAVACIKAYFQKHMHHNLLDEDSRMHQIVKIDIGAVLGSRRTLKYGRAPFAVKGDVQDDAPVASMTKATPNQVSRNWIPSLVRVECFTKDPYGILERVAVATDTKISVEHSESKDTFILVSADSLLNVEEALQRLKKLDGLLVLIDNPSQAYASFVPNTRGLRFCLQELAQLNDIAPRRLLLDPDSPIKNNITEFMVPVSCRIDPSNNLFHVSGHLCNPRGIMSPPLGENCETTESWSGFKFAEVGKASEDRGTQYAKVAGFHQPSSQVAEPAAGGRFPIHGSQLSQTRHEIGTRELSDRRSELWLQSGRMKKVHPQNDARVSRSTPVHESESALLGPFRRPGVKIRRPVLPEGEAFLTKKRTPVPSTNPTGSGKRLQSETATKFEVSFSAGPSATFTAAADATASQTHLTQSEILREEAEKKVCSDVSKLAKLQSSPEDCGNQMDHLIDIIKGVKILRTSPAPERNIAPSPCLSKSWHVSHTILASSEPVSEPGTRSGADDGPRRLVDFSDSEHAMADDGKTTSVSSNLENLESSPERSLLSLAVNPALLTAAGAQWESSVPQAAVSAISDRLPESAASRQSQGLKWPSMSLPSVTLADGDVAGDEEVTPRQAKILPPASRSPKSPDLRPHNQSTPESAQSIHISATGSTTTPQASGLGGMARGGGATFPYSMPPYQAAYQANPIPRDPWLEGRSRQIGTPAHDLPGVGQYSHGPSAMSLAPGYPVAYQHIAYPTLFPNWGITPMLSPELFLSANPARPGAVTSGPYQLPMGYSLPISQQQQLLPSTTSQQGQFFSQNPMAWLCEEFDPPTSIAGPSIGTTAPVGDLAQTTTATFPGQHDNLDPPIQERLANPDNNNEKEFHSIMRQRTPNPTSGTKGKLNSNVNEKLFKRRWRPLDDVSFTTKGASIPTSATAFTPESPPQDSSVHPELTKEVYELLAPMLTNAQVFPGPLQLEIQFGIATLINKLGAAEESFMSFEELNEAICPRGSLNGPSTVFFDRLTTLPADIDHFFSIHVDGTRLFESAPSIRTIDYEFHCVLKNGLPLVISIDEKGNASVNKSKVSLGSVDISFPDSIWDAAAVLHGYIGFHGEMDPEVERATQSLARNLWVEPNRTHVRLFTRIDTNVLSVKKVILKRTTYHHCSNDRYVSAIEDENVVGGFYLRVTEIQDLILTTHDSNGEILEAACKSLEDMAKAHRQWWEVALFSPAIHVALGDGVPTIIGDEHHGWSPIDILGNETGLVTSSPASSTAQSIGDYGLGSLLRLATVVVENIDPIGYFNVGPVGSGGNKKQAMRLLEWRSS